MLQFWYASTCKSYDMYQFVDINRNTANTCMIIMSEWYVYTNIHTCTHANVHAYVHNIYIYIYIWQCARKHSTM